jgi:hypothetical protein
LDWNRRRGLKPCKLYDDDKDNDDEDYNDNYDYDDDDDDYNDDDNNDDRSRAKIDTLKFEVLMAVTINLVCDTVLLPSRDAVRTTDNHVPINTWPHNTGDNMADKIMTAHS